MSNIRALWEQKKGHEIIRRCGDRGGGGGGSKLHICSTVRRTRSPPRRLLLLLLRSQRTQTARLTNGAAAQTTNAAARPGDPSSQTREAGRTRVRKGDPSRPAEPIRSSGSRGQGQALSEIRRLGRVWGRVGSCRRTGKSGRVPLRTEKRVLLSSLFFFFLVQ